MKIENIPITKLVPFKNYRASYDQEGLADLMRSINDVGVLQPIKVRPDGPLFEIVFGHRRYFASKKLGKEDVPCVVGVMTATDALVERATENLQRENPSFTELGMLFEELANQGLTTSQISARVGKSVNWVKNVRDAFIRLPMEIRDDVRPDGVPGQRKEGKLVLSQALAVSNIERTLRLTKKQGKDLYKYAAQDGVGNPSIRMVGKLIKEGMTLDQAINAAKSFRSVEVKILLPKTVLEKIKKRFGKSPASYLREEIMKITARFEA